MTRRWSASGARWPAGLGVLLLHLGFLSLLLSTARLPIPLTTPVLSTLVFIRPAAPPPAHRPRPDPELPRPAAWPRVPLPELPAIAPAPQGISVQPAPGEPSGASSAAPAAPLNLSLPANGGRGPAAPVPAQLAAQDSRANSPREGAVERMANALGAKGWSVIDLGDGSRKVVGPFGECQIIRPSMVDGIPGHPHAGLLPARVFGCGGVDKGSMKHERPK